LGVRFFEIVAKVVDVGRVDRHEGREDVEEEFRSVVGQKHHLPVAKVSMFKKLFFALQ
jgi:hypothetical protein